MTLLHPSQHDIESLHDFLVHHDMTTIPIVDILCILATIAICILLFSKNNNYHNPRKKRRITNGSTANQSSLGAQWYHEIRSKFSNAEDQKSDVVSYCYDEAWDRARHARETICALPLPPPPSTSFTFSGLKGLGQEEEELLNEEDEAEKVALEDCERYRHRCFYEYGESFQKFRSNSTATSETASVSSSSSSSLINNSFSSISSTSTHEEDTDDEDECSLPPPPVPFDFSSSTDTHEYGLRHRKLQQEHLNNTITRPPVKEVSVSPSPSSSWTLKLPPPPPQLRNTFQKAVTQSSPPTTPAIIHANSGIRTIQYSQFQFPKGSFSTTTNIQKAIWNGTPVILRSVPSSSSSMDILTSISTLRHPNICLYIGITAIPSSSSPPQKDTSLVMEYIENGSLFDMLQTKLSHPIYTEIQCLEDVTASWPCTTTQEIPMGTWPWKLICKIILGCTRGMMYLHSHDVIHGHLTSKNILLDSSFNPKIADFGLCIDEKEEFNDPNSCECSENNCPKPDDVYNFGMIAWEILIKRRPSPKHKDEDDCNQCLHHSIPSWFPLTLKSLIMKCLDESPEFRPSFSQILDYCLNDKNGFCL